MSRPFGSKNKVSEESAVNSTTTNTSQIVVTLNPIEVEIKNIKSRLDDIEQFRNTESIENRIRSLSEEFDNLVSTVNGIKQDILNNVKKYSEEEIKTKINSEIQGLMAKLTK